MANPFPFTAGQVLTAAQLNGIGEAWTTYTPAITQGVGVTSTVQRAKYARVNKLIFVSVSLACTSAGTGGNVISVTLPVTATAAAGTFGNPIGAGIFYDSSTTVQYNTSVTQNGTTALYLYANGSGGSVFGQQPAVTIANGDIIGFEIVYEAA
jgi:hypothetical protein